MNYLSRLLACLIAGLLLLTAHGAEEAAAEFTKPEATAAKTRYEQALSTGTQQYQRDLDVAMKTALQGGNLNEANAINAALKEVAAGKVVTPPFQTVAANSAKTRLLQTTTLAKQQYYRELDAALKTAMAAVDLNEANAINAARQKVLNELRPPAVVSATPRPPAGVTFGPVGTSSTQMKPGLLVKEYPRTTAQGDIGKVRVLLEDLGQPLPKTFVVKSILDWHHAPERNGVASGFIKIETDGTYVFNSNNGFNRNRLFVNDVEMQNGNASYTPIDLKKGMVPITSISYVEGGGHAKITWKPPGQKEMSEIPPKLLFHP